ncbi:hypothetical protein HWV62_31259 [Athelia sp. TMB]|nr:hypothetical protein HWV62_31131 [Athelia sp. TMB]KAF7986471.1 hypothetical protein HWV62_31259 [Athelia sp. TMB]
MSESIWTDPRNAKLYKAGEHITGAPAVDLIKQAGLLQTPLQRPPVILDNACGTGIVTSLLYQMMPEENVKNMDLVSGDISTGMVDTVKQRIEENGWKGVKAQVVDGMNTGFPDKYFTHVITNFGIMLMPEPEEALEECFRILQPGGICALTSWKTIGWIPDAREAIATIEGAPPFPDTIKFLHSMGKGEWHETSWVETTLKRLGFENIELNIARNVPSMGTPEAYGKSFSGMLGQMLLGSKSWTKDDLEKYGQSLGPAVTKFQKEKIGDKDVEFEMVAIIATARKPLSS